MAIEIIVRKIDVYYSDNPERHWLLFGSGEMSKPMLVLTNFEMRRLVEQYQEQQEETEERRGT